MVDDRFKTVELDGPCEIRHGRDTETTVGAAETAVCSWPL